MKKKNLLFRIFLKIIGGTPHYPSVFILLLALVPAIQLTLGVLQIVFFICWWLVLLWIIIRVIYILIFNKAKRAQIEGREILHEGSQTD